jgi:hypothetical protein
MAHPERPFQEAAFAFFGLDDRWVGLRWLGGHGRSNGLLHRLTLGHGDAPWDMTAARVNVQTRLPRPVHNDPETDLAIERHTLTREQVGIIWQATGDLPAELRAAAFQPGEPAADPTAPWEHIELPIDGRSCPFKLYSVHHTWVAQGQRGDALIAIDAHGWPAEPTGLLSVDQDRLRAYEDGSRQIRQARPQDLA